LLIRPILNANHLQTCLVSFPIILTLVIMTRMAPDHFANDPLSAQEENVVYSIRHFTKHFL